MPVLLLELLVILLPLLYALSIAFMPSSEQFTTEMNLLPSNPTLENFKQAMVKVPLARFVINSFITAGAITFGQIISCSLAAFSGRKPWLFYLKNTRYFLFKMTKIHRFAGTFTYEKFIFVLK